MTIFTARYYIGSRIHVLLPVLKCDCVFLALAIMYNANIVLNTTWKNIKREVLRKADRLRFSKKWKAAYYSFTQLTTHVLPVFN